MFRQDLVLRLIEQFGLLWSRLVKQLRAGLFPSARATLDQAYQEILGLPPEAVRTLSASELLARMQFETPPDLGRERCAILSALLRAEGDLAAEQQDPDLGAQHYQKSLDLLLACCSRTPARRCPSTRQPSISCLTALADYQLPPSSHRLLFHHYEQCGAFAKAENHLFELGDQLPQDQTVGALGEAFYRRLQSHSEAQLHAGDFSRREVKKGLTEWRRMIEPS